MKTLEELFEEIKNSEDMKKELSALAESKDKTAAADWMKKHGCNATLAEAKSFLAEKSDALNGTGELSPEELEQAAGGTGAPIGILTVGIIATISTMAACSNNESSGC